MNLSPMGLSLLPCILCVESLVALVTMLGNLDRGICQPMSPATAATSVLQLTEAGTMHVSLPLSVASAPAEYMCPRP